MVPAQLSHSVCATRLQTDKPRGVLGSNSGLGSESWEDVQDINRVNCTRPVLPPMWVRAAQSRLRASTQGARCPAGNASNHRSCRCLEGHLKRKPPKPQWEHDPQDHLLRTWAQQGTRKRLLLLQPIRMEGFFNVLCSLFRCVQPFATPWTVGRQTPLSMGFSRQEYWSGLLFPSTGDLPDPRIEPGSPALQADSLLFEPPGKPLESRTDSGQSQRLTSKLGAVVLVQNQGERTGRGGCFFHIVQWALKILHCPEHGATSKDWKPSWPRGPPAISLYIHVYRPWGVPKDRCLVHPIPRWHLPAGTHGWELALS